MEKVFPVPEGSVSDVKDWPTDKEAFEVNVRVKLVSMVVNQTQ